MNTFKLSNIPLIEFRRFLKHLGCAEAPAGRGGHEKWVKEGMTRQVILQSHICPVPEFVIKNALRDLGKTKNDLKDFMLGGTKAAKGPGAKLDTKSPSIEIEIPIVLRSPDPPEV